MPLKKQRNHHSPPRLPGYYRGPTKGVERMAEKVKEYVEEDAQARERLNMARNDKGGTPGLDESKRFPRAACTNAFPLLEWAPKN